MTKDALGSRRTFLATGMGVQEKTELPTNIYSGGDKSPLLENLENQPLEESVILPQLKIKKVKNSVSDTLGK